MRRGGEWEGRRRGEGPQRRSGGGEGAQDDLDAGHDPGNVETGH